MVAIVQFLSLSQWNLFRTFLDKNEILSADEELDPKNLPKQMPEYICIWIMDKYVVVHVHEGPPAP